MITFFIVGLFQLINIQKKTMQVKNLKELAETPKYVKYVLKIKSLEVASESAGENYES